MRCRSAHIYLSTSRERFSSAPACLLELGQSAQFPLWRDQTYKDAKTRVTPRLECRVSSHQYRTSDVERRSRKCSERQEVGESKISSNKTMRQEKSSSTTLRRRILELSLDMFQLFSHRSSTPSAPTLLPPFLNLSFLVPPFGLVTSDLFQLVSVNCSIASAGQRRADSDGCFSSDSTTCFGSPAPDAPPYGSEGFSGAA